MNQAPQEGPGGDNDGAGGKCSAIAKAYPGDPAIGDDQFVRLAFDNAEIDGFADRRLHGRGIQFPIGLGPWPAHGRPLAAVEHPELDATGIRHPAHQAVEGVDLADQMTLAETADGGVAGHRADGGKAVGHQRRLRAHTGGRSGGFTAGVAATNHDDVEEFLGHGAIFYPGAAKAESEKLRG